MKKVKNNVLTMLCLTILSSSSSCSGAPLAPQQVEDRRLRLKADAPAVVHYEYDVCVKKFLGICTKTEVKEETYDLRNPQVWKSLIDMGFTLTSERRWK